MRQSAHFIFVRRDISRDMGVSIVHFMVHRDSGPSSFLQITIDGLFGQFFEETQTEHERQNAKNHNKNDPIDEPLLSLLHGQIQAVVDRLQRLQVHPLAALRRVVHRIANRARGQISFHGSSDQMLVHEHRRDLLVVEEIAHLDLSLQKWNLVFSLLVFSDFKIPLEAPFEVVFVHQEFVVVESDIFGAGLDIGFFAFDAIFEDVLEVQAHFGVLVVPHAAFDDAELSDSFGDRCFRVIQITFDF